VERAFVANGMQHAACSMQHAACSMQHAAALKAYNGSNFTPRPSIVTAALWILTAWRSSKYSRTALAQSLALKGSKSTFWAKTLISLNNVNLCKKCHYI
jgi:hypothetical protein